MRVAPAGVEFFSDFFADTFFQIFFQIFSYIFSLSLFENSAPEEGSILGGVWLEQEWSRPADWDLCTTPSLRPTPSGSTAVTLRLQSPALQLSYREM